MTTESQVQARMSDVGPHIGEVRRDPLSPRGLPPGPPRRRVARVSPEKRRLWPARPRSTARVMVRAVPPPVVFLRVLVAQKRGGAYHGGLDVHDREEPAHGRAGGPVCGEGLGAGVVHRGEEGAHEGERGGREPEDDDAARSREDLQVLPGERNMADVNAPDEEVPMPETPATERFWFTEDGKVLCDACAREAGLSPDDPASGLEEFTPECAWETNRDLGDGFQSACSTCGKFAPARRPPMRWRARCPNCGEIQLFAGKPGGPRPCPRCGTPRRVEANPVAD